MHQLTFCLAFLTFFGQAVFAQNELNDREIEAIITDLIAQTAGDSKVKNVAVIDFSDLDNQPMRLGKYLAQEFSFHLSRAKKSFTVIDRSKLAYLFREDSLALLGLIDPATLVEIGPKLKGIDALVYGTLTDAGDYFRVNLTLLSVETQSVLASSRGDVTKTPTIRNFSTEKTAIKTKPKPTVVSKKTDKPKTAEPPKPIALFRKDNLRFDLLECRQAGSAMDCSIQISNDGDDLDLHIYGNQSRILLAPNGHERGLSTIRLADKTNSHEVQKTLTNGAKIKAMLSFQNISGQPEGISKMEVICWTQDSGYYSLEFRNIPIVR